MQIGIHTSWAVLQAKLEARDEPGRTTETWQLTRLPQNLSKDEPNYLFVAVDGVWQGYFRLGDEIMWNPEDKRAPYSLVFDTRTWVEIKGVETKRFRGFTYNVPSPDQVEPVR